jgi:rubrerythrin
LRSVIVQEFSSLDEVLDFAISMEHVSHQFYVELAQQTERPDVRDLFLALAREELLHAERLGAMKGRSERPLGDQWPAVPVGGYVAATSVEGMSYMEALKLAVDKEKGSYTFYRLLALSMDEPELKGLFGELARIEAEHRDVFQRHLDALRIGGN